MGEQEVYENVDFAAKEDLLRWLDLDYTQVNTAHHLRNKVRLTQTPALTTPGSCSSVKDDIRSGEQFSWEEAGICCTVYSKSAGILCVCVCVGRGEFMNGGMPTACQYSAICGLAEKTAFLR
jgi:hypothetical protein